VYPRFGSLLCPPFAWCPVRGGRVVLEDATQDGGTKGGLYPVGGFAIARYPVTNAQFQLFVEHPHGFSNPCWWAYSPQAVQWHEDHPSPKPTAFTGDNLPRTRVSWFDSLAFCCWLSAGLSNQAEPPVSLDPGDISTWRIRLPSEQEWQYAALGDTGWDYPWGNELAGRYANYANHIGQPTAVDRYPAGKSIFGVMDLIGNVWEWCLSAWNAETIDLSGYAYRVIKGGAWNVANPAYLRANDRSGHPPRGRLNDCGFRILLTDSR
jgi:formylglycine-generating enzyme required for sulfatase activity